MTWIYQGALLLTHDLVAIVVVKSLLTAAILLWGLLEVGRAANLRRPIALLALLSPFLFFYGRVLWDNVFLLPASALLFAVAGRCFRPPSLLRWRARSGGGRSGRGTGWTRWHWAAWGLRRSSRSRSGSTGSTRII